MAVTILRDADIRIQGCNDIDYNFVRDNATDGSIKITDKVNTDAKVTNNTGTVL